LDSVTTTVKPVAFDLIISSTLQLWLNLFNISNSVHFREILNNVRIFLIFQLQVAERLKDTSTQDDTAF
jgi:hypothetical protein